ncbi:uncharacterized protein N7458_000952 [Penicillium daleae]|uniref:Uncharacterized protein n=1 Tax=Penicillium daleae TaxID=63821 RepID=A0AAD6G9C9_9EURO|nr:uncharacterized protein N7458_000952 [Penicillium daleae]KAJ5465266.1 hypothetical protein N7458_000952 [Penicillium daleae]
MIERRLKSHVDNVVDSAMSECRDQIYDECKANEAELREQIDDGNSEIQNTTNEYQAQRYMDGIEDHGIEVGLCAEEKIAKLECWFNGPVRSPIDSKSGPSHDLDANARRRLGLLLSFTG